MEDGWLLFYQEESDLKLGNMIPRKGLDVVSELSEKFLFLDVRPREI